MTFLVLACLVPAFAISCAATGLMRRLAPKWGLVDQPGHRKVHVKPTPLGGGVGIWLGVVVPLAVAHACAAYFSGTGTMPTWVPDQLAAHVDGVLFRAPRLWAIIAAGTLLAAMGLLDDLRNLPWVPRLLVQFCVAAGLVASGVRTSIATPLPWLDILLSAMWIIVLVNSFNFLDNMDGLSSGIAMIAALLFAIIMLTTSSTPHWLVGGVMLILAGALGGFLCHNWSPAKIFMGDSGSYFIGLLLATMTILGTYYDETDPQYPGPHVILAPLCILAIPLYDFASVMFIRLVQGRSPFHADKSHFSHRLVELGLRPRNAVLTIHLATLTTGLGALLLYRIADFSGALLVISLILCVLAIVAILETAGRRNNDR